MRFVSDKGPQESRLRDARDLQRATVDAAEIALRDFDTDAYRAQYPGAVDVWRNAWPEFVPFLDFPVELRKIVYTTNAFESINFSYARSPRTAAISPTRTPR